MEIIISSIVGALLGFLIGLLIGKSQKHSLITKIEVLQTQIQNIESQSEKFLLDRNKQIDQIRSESVQRLEEVKTEALRQQEQLRQEYEERIQKVKQEGEKRCSEISAEKDKLYQGQLETKERYHQESMESQQKRFEEITYKVSAQMKSATEEMLKQRQKEFAESSNINLGQIVNPLRETIDKMKQAMNESTLKQTAIGSEMKANIENMMRQSEAARKSAEELTRVFKHGYKVQGDWGEMVLEELLESQGLTRGVHYETQTVFRDIGGKVIKSEENKMLRPDVILHLGCDREVIIDSKVSLTAFIDYVNAETEIERQKYLNAHVESLKKHVKELSQKNYSEYIQPPKVKMDYVIMFVPNTNALWVALRTQPDLWRRAMEQNVFIADEQTLFAALRIISQTWLQIERVKNHEKIFKLAEEMLDRVRLFMKYYEQIGTNLEKAAEAYEEGKKKLDPKGRSILQTCCKLIDMGAKINNKEFVQQLDINELAEVSEGSIQNK